MRKLMLLVILAGFNAFIFAQKDVQLLKSESSIVIKGTSSLHDWEEKVQKFDVSLDLRMKDNKIENVENVKVICKTESITSDYDIMTSKTHKALRAKEHPEIVFKTVRVDEFQINQGKFNGTVTGDLTIGGKTRRIKLPFSGSNGSDIITIKGSKEIAMSDFDIDPPTAIMGTLKTGDKIVIDFNLQFQQSITQVSNVK